MNLGEGPEHNGTTCRVQSGPALDSVGGDSQLKSEQMVPVSGNQTWATYDL